jgi:hypothetical protein
LFTEVPTEEDLEKKKKEGEPEKGEPLWTPLF